MTLRELVEKYDGEASFAVCRLVSGGTEDVVEFSCTDCEAIKDEILDSTVNKYSADTSTTTRSSVINVTLDEVVDEVVDEVPDDTSEPTEP